MRWLRVFLSRHSVAAVLVFLTILLSFVPPRWGTAVRARVIVSLPPGPHAFLSGLAEAEEDLLGAENRRLRAEVASLSNRCEVYSRQAEDLAVLAGRLPEVPRGLRLAASIVFCRDPTPYTRTFWIDRGSAHGVRQGQAVVSGAVIVGKVLQVTEETSLVRSVQDPDFAVMARAVRTRAQGVARGTGSGRLRWLWVRRSEDVQVGDAIVSTGLDGKAPPGLVIGRVAMVGRDESGAFHEVEVAPAADLSEVERVVVLLGSALPPTSAAMNDAVLRPPP